MLGTADHICPPQWRVPGPRNTSRRGPGQPGDTPHPVRWEGGTHQQFNHSLFVRQMTQQHAIVAVQSKLNQVVMALIPPAF